MYPPVIPHDQGMLELADGARLYWEESGNPDGIPALYLHGGPGSTMRAGYRRKFDPARYRIIGLQQRGIGQSTPHVTDAAHRHDLDTTVQLVGDLEVLREHLGVDRWLVSGVSWGSTLALHYAIAHPERVLGLVLVAVTTTSPDEVAWITEGVQILYPEAWDRLASFVEQNSPWRRGEGRLIEAVDRIMQGPDAELRSEMAMSWMDWEDSHIQIGLHPADLKPVTLSDRPIDEQVAFTTLVARHWAAHARLDADYVPEGGILTHLAALADIPLCMVHGRRDVSGPVTTPWAIKQVLPRAALHVVEHEGHGGPVMMELWCRATDSFATTGGFDQMVELR